MWWLISIPTFLSCVVVTVRLLCRHFSRLSWRFCQSSDFQSWADFVLVMKVLVQRLWVRILLVRERASRSLPPSCQLLSEVFLSGWKKVRLNFTCQSLYFKTFPLLWDVCGRTSQLDLDLLYNYPNCWGSKYYVNITKSFSYTPHRSSFRICG